MAERSRWEWGGRGGVAISILVTLALFYFGDLATAVWIAIAGTLLVFVIRPWPHHPSRRRFLIAVGAATCALESVLAYRLYQTYVANPRRRSVLLNAAASIGAYPANTKLGGIDWRGLTDLRINATNVDGETVTNLDLLVTTEPQYSIYRMAQLSSLPGVYFADASGVRNLWLTARGFRDVQRIPFDPGSPNWGSTHRRVYCERIGPGATLDVVAELGVLPRGRIGPQPVPDDIRELVLHANGSYNIGAERHEIHLSLPVALAHGDEPGRKGEGQAG
jgi:hypothetical protein